MTGIDSVEPRKFVVRWGTPTRVATLGRSVTRSKTAEFWRIVSSDSAAPSTLSNATRGIRRFTCELAIVLDRQEFPSHRPPPRHGRLTVTHRVTL